jgi:hypothetical protein
MKFTKHEREFLLDRPADCVEECLCERFHTVDGATIAAAVADAQALIEAKKIFLCPIPPLVAAAIEDMVEGSTFLARIDEAFPTSRRLWASRIRVLRARLHEGLGVMTRPPLPL